MKPTAIAARAMIRRARSSPRCSTSVASSPWRRRRGSLAMCLGGRGGRRLVAGGARQLGLLVVTGDRVLELAHPAPERAADLGQSLGPEHEQRDDQDDDEPGNADFRHLPSVAFHRPGMDVPCQKSPWKSKSWSSPAV